MIATGYLGLTFSELYDITLREFFIALEGYNERKENEYKSEMEAARFTAWLVVASFSEKRFTASEMFVFPWEKQEVYELPVTEFKKLVEKWVK